MTACGSSGGRQVAVRGLPSYQAVHSHESDVVGRLGGDEFIVDDG